MSCNESGMTTLLELVAVGPIPNSTVMFLACLSNNTNCSSVIPCLMTVGSYSCKTSLLTGESMFYPSKILSKHCRSTCSFEDAQTSWRWGNQDATRRLLRALLLWQWPVCWRTIWLVSSDSLNQEIIAAAIIYKQAYITKKIIIHFLK